MKREDTKCRILVVDDTEENLDILLATLGAEYEVSVAMDGKTALQCADDVMPDLILLDIMMPEMDGYDVCRALKANRATQDIPVIFLTALSAEAAEEVGLSLGAIDYITKPFSPALVKARVGNHVALRRSQLDIIRQRDQLEIAYENLRTLEKMRDDLVHLVVHDLRTPLTGILGYLGLALSDPNAGSSVSRDECLSRAMQSANRLADMVTSVLDVSRLESGKMPLNYADCDLRELTDAVVKRLASMTQLRKVTVVSPAAPPRSHCDSEVIQRVIQNLLGNALKFTPPDGSITITIVPEEQWIRLIVADNGPGIPPQYHKKVFEKFGQVEMRKEGQPSTGLGLAFCKLAVEAHGGGIQLVSEPGRGTEFHVLLPVAIPVESAAAAGSSGRPESSGSMGEDIRQKEIGVLLVDDERGVTDSIKRYLEKNTRWSVTAINNPEHVVRAALDEKPGLIILDIDMPRLSGTDISVELKRFPSLKKAVIVFLTGLMRPEEAGKSGFGKSGNYPVIAKGLPMAKLLDALTTLLGDSQPA